MRMAIVTAIGTTMTTYKELSKFIDAIVDAPKKIRALSTNTSNIHAMISNLHSALKERKILDVIAHDTLIQEHVQGLDEALGSYNKTLRHVIDKLGEHFHAVKKEYKVRVRW